VLQNPNSKPLRLSPIDASRNEYVAFSRFDPELSNEMIVGSTKLLSPKIDLML
jgi:hypothetical protein